MHKSFTAPAQINTYKGMRIGGVFTVAACGLTLFGILSTAVTAGTKVDVSVPISAGVGCLVGSMLVLAGMILHGVSQLIAKLDEHKADHEQATLAVEDVQGINSRLDNVDRRTAETLDILAHATAGPVVEPDDAASGERRAYAAGAVDMLDGRAAILPGLRVVPVQDPRRHA